MRFPVDPTPPISLVDNPYEIQEAAAIKGLRPLGPSPQGPQTGLQRQQVVEPVARRPAEEDTRTGADRRQTDRRHYTLSVLVDTRLGRDRRQSRRRPTDPPAPSVNEKA